jgi:hypothetical protein
MQRPHHPSKEEIVNLAPMNRLGLADIVLINRLNQAEMALQTLLTQDVLGFDTESKRVESRNTGEPLLACVICY